MSEQCRSKVGWKNVGNVGATSEQGGVGKHRSKVRARWEGKWYMTAAEIDAHFQSMPGYPGLHWQHFKNGISFISQWTGHEHKEMQQIFVSLLAGHLLSPQQHSYHSNRAIGLNHIRLLPHTEI